VVRSITMSMSVCLCICLFAMISQERLGRTSCFGSVFFYSVAYSLYSLFTASSVHVMFSHNGPYGASCIKGTETPGTVLGRFIVMSSNSCSVYTSNILATIWHMLLLCCCRLNRQNAILLSCGSGNAECLGNISFIFNTWLHDQKSALLCFNIIICIWQ